MNLTHLAAFHAVAEAGSVSAGAERLMVSQPAVSKQVRALEQSLGAALFDRLPKGVRLTEAGRALAAHARRLFAEADAAERAVAELRGLRRGRLAVGASMTIGSYLMPDVMARFHRQYPGVELHLEIANSHDVQERLLEHRLDVGLIEGFVESPDELEAEVFASDEMVAVAPAGHPLTKRKSVSARTFCREPFIAREPGSGTRAVVERALAAKGITVTPAMSIGGNQAIKLAVAAGAGVAIVSRLTIAQDLKLGTLAVVRLSDLTIRRPLYRLHPRGRHVSPAVRAFVESLMLGEADDARRETRRGPKTRAATPPHLRASVHGQR